MDKEERGSGILSTVVTTSRILELLSSEGGAFPVSISKKLNLSRSKVHRLLATLRELDYVEERHDGRYVLTFRLFEMGNTVPFKKRLIDTARPSMLRLAQLTGETVNNGVLYDDRVLYIDKVEAVTHLKLDRSIGSNDPLHNTSLGKVLLAFLDPEEMHRILSRLELNPTTRNTITDREELLEELALVRERGYALDLQELSMDIRCVAAPVIYKSGKICSAVSVSGPAGRFSLETAEKLVPDLQATVREISRMIEA